MNDINEEMEQTSDCSEYLNFRRYAHFQDF